MPGIVRRRETKYEISANEYVSLVGAVSKYLPRFEFKPGRPYTHISTVYYDTEGQKFFNRAVRHYESSLKLRLKEYYYNSASGGTETTPYCFVELKERANGEVHKRRLRIPKELVGDFFERQAIWEQLVARDPGIEFQDSTHEIYDELDKFLKSNCVRPSSVINYRRVVYQKDERDLRITFDDQLQVFQPVHGLFGAIDALTCERLDAPICDIPSRIMEIKSVGSYPKWLDEALGSYCPRKMSKFTTSVDFLNSHLPGRPGANGNGNGVSSADRVQHDGDRGRGGGVEEPDKRGGVKRKVNDAEASRPDAS